MISGMKIQIAIDCADPHALVRFWASLLGYEIEQDPAFVQRMLDLGHASPDDTTVVDGVLTWREAVACQLEFPDSVTSGTRIAAIFCMSVVRSPRSGRMKSSGL